MMQQNALQDFITTETRAAPAKIPRHFEGFSGFERIVLTAGRNLQRVISAYFNMPVTVDIVDNTQVPLTEMGHPGAMDRFVREVLITDKKVYDLVVRDCVAIGQIFRYLDRLPSFELHGLGRTEQTFWREYSLKSPGVDCRLLEICSPQERIDWRIDWKVEMFHQDKIAWVNPIPEVK
ncbi:hypothetical protein BGZ82_000930 [Podila clonocystis]|nr:hypothetical protein BGZ82_000930 [Podila clonocystis]